MFYMILRYNYANFCALAQRVTIIALSDFTILTCTCFGSGSSYHTYDIPCRRPDTVLVHACMSNIWTRWLVSFVSSHSHVIELVRLVPCVLDHVRCLFLQHRMPACPTGHMRLFCGCLCCLYHLVSSFQNWIFLSK